MMARKHAKLRIACLLLTVALLFASVPLPAIAEETASCLSIAGQASLSPTAVVKGEPFTVTYTLAPQGTLPSAEERTPVDISLVLDVSGSMDYPVSSTDPQRRIDALKQASRTLLQKLKEVQLNDRIGLIKFSTSATKVSDLTTDYDQVQSKINAFDPNGGTNIDHGLTLADAMLSASSAEKRFVILLTDGKATHYTDNKNKTYSAPSEAQQEALKDAQALAGKGIVVHTIALAEAGSKDVDIDLLREIADRTNGQMYEAASAQQLAAAFERIAGGIGEGKKLGSIVLTQPLPPGFQLADGNGSNVRIENGQLVVAVGDIPYPFGASSQLHLPVRLKQVYAAGEYSFPDAKVTYTNACGQSAEQPIRVEGTLSVTVQVADRYGNVYVGYGDGKIVRKRAADQAPQWEINTAHAAVTDIRFGDADLSDGIADDTIVNVSYANNEQTAWSLIPTKPVVAIQDKNGAPVTDGEWYQGPGSVTASGSTNRLPDATIYLNEDFRANYISGYEYRIGDGEWTPMGDSNPVPDGKQSEVEVRAVTHAVSGNSPHYSETAGGAASFDSTPPETSIAFDIAKPSDDATITITAVETMSPVTNLKVWLDDSPSVSIEADASNIRKDGNEYSFRFRLSDVYPQRDRRVGWHKIVFEAASKGGTTRSAPEYFLVNPGPNGELKPEGYQPGTVSDKPVTIKVDNLGHPVADRTFGSVTKPGLKVKQMYYAIKRERELPSAAEWKPLNATQFRVTVTGDATAGTYYVYLKIVDDDTPGVETVTSDGVEIKIDFNQNRY